MGRDAFTGAEPGRLPNRQVLWEKRNGGLFTKTPEKPFGASFSFAVFAIVSFRTAWLGIASCGCFGNLGINPWISFSVDTVVLTALFMSRPFWPLIAQESLRVGLIGARSMAIASLLLGAIYLVALATFGTWQQAKASLRGEMITLEQHEVISKTFSPEEIITIPFTVSNYSGKSVEIYGGSNDCSCQATGTLPLRLAAGEQKELTVRVRLPNMAGVFRRRIYLLTDHEDARHIEATFRCLVGKSAE